MPENAMHEEKRGYVRIETFIRGRLRLLPSPKSPPLFAGYHSSYDQVDKNALLESRLPEPLVDFLLGLNDRLEALTSFMGQDRLQTDFPLVADVTEVSGAGIRFELDSPLPPETSHAEIVLVLNQFPLRLAGAIGRLEPREPDSESGRPAYAMIFTRIREQDLDQIIGFVFQEERRRIREKKWD